MKKQILGIVAASIMVSGTAFADEPVMSKFKMSIGGFVKLDYVYNSTDLGQTAGMLAPGSGLIPRTSSAAGQSDQSEFTARQSRLWFKVAGPELYGAKTNALIEGDFYGDYLPASSSRKPAASECGWRTVPLTGPTPRSCSASSMKSSAR